MYLLLTSLVYVVLASWIPFKGNVRGKYQGVGIILLQCCTFCQTVREDMAIVDVDVDVRMVILVSIAPFHCMPASRRSDSTPGSRRLPLCAHDYRALRAVEAALQTATAVVSSHDSWLVVATGGNSVL